MGGGGGARGEYRGGIRGREKEGYPEGGDCQRERRGRNWIKLGNIALIIIDNRKRAEVAGRDKKKRRRKLQIQGECDGKMDPLWVLCQGFLYTSSFSPFRPSRPLSLKKKKNKLLMRLRFFYSSSVTNLTMRKKKSNPFGTRLNKS